MTEPTETVDDVLAEIRAFPEAAGIRALQVWADRIERAMAASAVPVATINAEGKPLWIGEHPLGVRGFCGCLPEGTKLYTHAPAVPVESLCSDCPPVGYPADSTRCKPCPRRAVPTESLGRDAPIGCTADELLEDAIRNVSRPVASVPDGWRNVLQRARQGLGAGGAWGTPGSRQRELEVEIGGRLLDHIEDGLELLFAQPTTPEESP